MYIVYHLHFDRIIFEKEYTVVAIVVLNCSTTISYLEPLLDVLNLLHSFRIDRTLFNIALERSTHFRTFSKKDFDGIYPQF
jgi:hypothetical protein